jgi:hypothetical protein
MADAKASDLITEEKYEAFERIFHECFPDQEVMTGYLILRVLSFNLERDMGIPPVVVDGGDE